jgi:hypothetical protein
MENIKGTIHVHTALLGAIRREDVERVRELLVHPDLNINGDQYGDAPIHHACGWVESHRERDPLILQALLAHPGINVNIQHPNWSDTALAKACFYNNTKCAITLLQDPRVNVSLLNVENESALYAAAMHGCVDIIKHWFALGRDVDLRRGEPGDVMSGARKPWPHITNEKHEAKRKVVRLLRDYYADPVGTKDRLVRELGLSVGEKEKE